MKNGIALTIMVQKIGPYHHARFEAAARYGSLSVIEFRSDDTVYAWSEVCSSDGYNRIKTKNENLLAALEKLNPDVLVCVGYSDREIHRAMSWAVTSNVPMVVCSDSTFADERRSAWREALKRQLLSAFKAGLVAGTKASEYLQYLGLNRSQLFTAWDVVDNDYFSECSEARRREDARWRSEFGLPQNYFLCVSRFIAKKNLAALVAAYRDYVADAGEAAWGLVLCGGGQEDAAIRTQVAAAGLQKMVYFTGFKQYGDLPVYYGLAAAFVLPSLSDQWGLVVNEAMAAGLPVLVSERCGCAVDLVESGINGYVFDPARTQDITAKLVAMARLSKERRTVMGQRSREIVAKYSLDTFARGVWASACFAHTRRNSRVRLFSRWLLSIMTR